MRISFDESAHRERKVRFIISVKVFSLDSPLDDLGTTENSIYIEESIRYWKDRIPNYNDKNEYVKFLTEYCKKINTALKES